MAIAISDKLLLDARRQRGIGMIVAGYGPVVIAYILATTLTGAYFMGDTVDYVDSIVTGTQFWDFGHLFWRPLGLILFQALEPVVRSITNGGDRVNAAFIFVAVNWVAGALSVIFMRGWLGQVCTRPRIADTVTIGFALSHAFLNFAQTGSSYIPGLSLLLLGLFLLAKSSQDEPMRAGEDAELIARSRDESSQSTRRTRNRALIAGLAFAGAVCLWFPYAFAIPGALLTPIALFGIDRGRLRPVLRASLVVIAALLLAYGAVIAHLRFSSVAEVRAWIADSSHGIKTAGVSRAVIGLPRSIVNIGNDGLLFKRYLLNDPLNSVNAIDLVRTSLWKLLLAYLGAALIVELLLKSRRGKRTLVWMAVACLPALVFAVIFDGGAVERYLILHPALFLAIGVALETRSGRTARILIVAGIVAASAVNLAAMSLAALTHRQEVSVSRIAGILPTAGPGTRIVTINQQDEIINFKRSFPFHAANSRFDLQIRPLLQIGTTQVDTWREEFASQTESAWERCDDVWISVRVFAERPRADWYWVEGDDARVSWTDVRALFAGLETGQPRGEDDGFVLLLPTERNKLLLGRAAASETASKAQSSQVRFAGDR